MTVIRSVIGATVAVTARETRRTRRRAPDLVVKRAKRTKAAHGHVIAGGAAVTPRSGRVGGTDRVTSGNGHMIAHMTAAATGGETNTRRSMIDTIAVIRDDQSHMTGTDGGPTGDRKRTITAEPCGYSVTLSKTLMSLKTQAVGGIKTNAVIAKLTMMMS